MPSKARFLLAACLLGSALSPQAKVVINEIFYNAPDEISKLQWIELHNTDSQAIDLTGWKLRDGIEFEFPPNTSIAANGFLVLCQNATRFAEFYSAPVAGEFKKSLKGSGETIELVDKQGQRVDRARFSDDAPWPLAADGYSASLERITPASDGMLPSNWIGSPLAQDEVSPAGTPGARNHSFSAHFPPVLSRVTLTPSHPKPGEPIQVSAVIEHPTPIPTVEVRFQIAMPGSVSEESAVPMKRSGNNQFAGTIPPQAEGTLLRVRVRAVDANAAERSYPAPTELRPALSVYVQSPPEKASIPLAFVISTDSRDVADGARYIERSRHSMGHPFQDQKRWRARETLGSGMDLATAWIQVSIHQSPTPETYTRLRNTFRAYQEKVRLLSDEIESSGDMDKLLAQLPQRVEELRRAFTADIESILPVELKRDFKTWAAEQSKPPQLGPERFFRNLLKLEAAWLALNHRFDLANAQVDKLRPVMKKALEGRSLKNPELQALQSDAANFPKLQAIFGEVEKEMWTDLRQALNYPQRRYLQGWFSDHGSFIRPRPSEIRATPPRGTSAFIVVDPQSQKPEVFDFVNVRERSAGFKVRFHKDHTFRGMNTVNMIFEYDDRFVLAEPLAYDFYRRAGCPAPATEFVRLTLDGKLVGYHLVFEQINRSFLRRNQRNANGDLYKLAWYGRSIESQHEKQNTPDSDHSALVELVNKLGQAQGDAQWALIERNFNVDQVINYFAANMCLSHWDGFFNNYFAYHDRKGSGKWEIYPWDQDKTWGYYDAIEPGEVFFNMPLTYGMEGDLPPGGGPATFNPRSWWRPGGFFSKPLLANSQFRGKFVHRMREILEEQFSPTVMFPVIDNLAARLRPEVEIRARALNQDPAEAAKRLDTNIASIKENLTKRREFLLNEAEIKVALNQKRQ